MNDSVEQVVEEQLSRRRAAYRVLLSVALAMISFGQFNDTKELLSDLYERVTTNFTHTIEYKKLDELSIGRTIDFIEAQFGPPEVIKQSAYDDNVVFQYYNLKKAVVTILNHKGRVAGFVVVPLKDDFAPTMPFVEKAIGTQTFQAEMKDTGDFFFDANNLVYFAESQDLGKRFLFLQRVLGVIEYGKLTTFDSNDEAHDSEKTLDMIGSFNDLLLADDEARLVTAIEGFRTTRKPNFYAYTELDPSLIAESLLTRIEFSTYFGDKS